MPTFSGRNLLNGILAMSLFIASIGVFAASPATSLSYTNVDVGVVSTELNNTSLNGDGLLLRGSLAIDKNFFLFAQFADIGYNQHVDGIYLAAGGGGRVAATNTLDIVGKLGIAHQKTNGSGGFSENGYLLSATARGFVVPKLELEGGVKHEHLSETGNNTSLIAEGRYFFTDRIAGGVFLQVGDATSFGINGRFVF